MCERIAPDGLEEPLPFYTLYNYDHTFKKYKQVSVDCCLVRLITTLHSLGIRTLGSCCGHGNYCGGIVIDSHSVGKAIQSGFSVNKEWRADYSETNNGDDFVIYQIERFNDSCRGCTGHSGCPCSCHEEIKND